MRNLYAVIQFFLSICPVLAQNWTWDSILVSSSTVGAHQLEKDRNGNVFVYSTAMIQKLSGNRTLIWTVNFPQNMKVWHAHSAADSSLYVTGTFSGSCTFGNTNISSSGSLDIFICRITGQGAVSWLTRMGGTDEELPGQLKVSGNHLYLTGKVYNNFTYQSQSFTKPTGGDIFIAKCLKSNGQLSNMIYSSQAQSWGEYMAVDGSGNIVVTCQMDVGLSMQLGGTTITNNLAPWQSYLLKFTPNLQMLWYQPMGGYKDYPGPVITGLQDEIICTLNLTDQYGSSLGRIYRYSPAGNFLGINYNVNGLLYGLDQDSCHNIYFCGFKAQGPGLSSPNCSLSVLAGQLSPGGILTWTGSSSSSTGWRQACSIAVLGPNNCLLSGQFFQSLTLANTYTNSTPNGYPNFDNFLSSLSANLGTLPMAGNYPANICAGKSATITCTGTGLINWYNSNQASPSIGSGNSFTFSPPQAGSYTLYAQSSTCSLTSNFLPIPINVYPSPVITASGGTICAGQGFNIQPQGASTYSFVSGGPVVYPNVTSNYSIFGMDQNGCSNSAVCTVTVNPGPALTVQGNSQICAGQTCTLLCQGAVSYSINLLSASQPVSIQPTITTAYMISGEDSAHCVSGIIQVVMVQKCLGLEQESSTVNYRIYPSPSQGILHYSGGKAEEILLYDSNGQVVFRRSHVSEDEQMDTGGLANGLYLVEIVSGQDRYFQRIIIQRS